VSLQQRWHRALWRQGRRAAWGLQGRELGPSRLPAGLSALSKLSGARIFYPPGRAWPSWTEVQSAADDRSASPVATAELMPTVAGRSSRALPDARAASLRLASLTRSQQGIAVNTPAARTFRAGGAASPAGGLGRLTVAEGLPIHRSSRPGHSSRLLGVVHEGSGPSGQRQAGARQTWRVPSIAAQRAGIKANSKVATSVLERSNRTADPRLFGASHVTEATFPQHQGPSAPGSVSLLLSEVAQTRRTPSGPGAQQTASYKGWYAQVGVSSAGPVRGPRTAFVSEPGSQVAAGASVNIVPRRTALPGGPPARGVPQQSLSATDAPPSFTRAGATLSMDRKAVPGAPPQVVSLRGEVVLDGRKVGQLVVKGQTGAARLPSSSSSGLNLRTMPVFSGTSAPL